MYEIIIGRDEDDRKKFGLQGVFLLGKHYVKMGQTSSLSNDVLVDAARTHVIFVCGKRGSGKCVTGDTLIPLNDGSLVPIESLAEKQSTIFGLNDSLKIVPLETKEFFEREVNKVIKIRLRSGREIKLTPEHPLLTIKGWKPAEELSLGSRIATERRIECFGNEQMPESEIKLLACYGKKSNEKEIPQQVFRLKKELLALFLNRLFSCDGSIYKHNEGNGTVWEISYSSSSARLSRQVQHLLLRFGILSRLRIKNVKCNNKDFKSYELNFNSLNVVRFIEEIGFFGDKKNKEIISKMSEFSIQYMTGGKLRLPSTSIDEKILSTKNHQATGINVKSHQSMTGGSLEKITQISRNPDIDTVPKEIWEFFRPRSWAEIGRAVGYKHPQAMRERIKYSPSRQTLLQIAKTEQNPALMQLAKSDIFWDEIISMELLEGTFKVYDLSVPVFHNFIANDIIIHNSYTEGVIAEGLGTLPNEIAQNISTIILDTMGVFWTMKYDNKKEEDLLKEWKLTPQGIKMQIFTPEGYFKEFKDKGIPTDFPFSIRPSELSPSDWCMTFKIDINQPVGVLIERVIGELSEKGENFSVEDIITKIDTDTRFEKNVKDAAINRFLTAKTWGLFSTKGTKADELIAPGKLTVLDISCYSALLGNKEVTNLVVGLVSKKIFLERMIYRRKEELEEVQQTFTLSEQKQTKKELPLIWLLIDEAHEFLPRHGETTATQPLLTLLREGRQPGISMVLASQQPGQIHTDVITQSDIVISHRLTAKIDIDALGFFTQSYLRENLDKILNDLPRIKGSAVVFDDINERTYPIQTRPRLTWHGGQSPTPIRKKRELFSF